MSTRFFITRSVRKSSWALPGERPPPERRSCAMWCFAFKYAAAAATADAPAIMGTVAAVRFWDRKRGKTRTGHVCKLCNVRLHFSLDHKPQQASINSTKHTSCSSMQVSRARNMRQSEKEVRKASFQLLSLLNLDSRGTPCPIRFRRILGVLCKLRPWCCRVSE